MEIFVVYGIICYIIMLYFISKLADRFNRNPSSWVLFAIVFTPLIAVFGLACLGTQRKDVIPRVKGLL